MTSKNLTGTLISGLIALLCALPATAANLAGSAVFVSGKVTATDPAGGIRELQARDEVYSGDLLETRRGRVQIKFADGAFMSIQPNSRFQIEEYHYANKSDGSEKAIYNLLKGGMRAFTGAIGKAHPDAYKVKTPVATIGIRGTGHNTRICQGDCSGTDGLLLPDGLYHTTWEGITFVENDFGITDVPTFMSIYVQSIDSPAQETNEASQVTAVQPSQNIVEELVEEQEEQVTLVAGDQRNSSGNPGALPPPPPPDMGMVQNQTLLGIETNLSRDFMDPENAGGGLVSSTTVLVGPDSMDTVGMFATVGMVFEEDGMGVEEMKDFLITIDPNGVLAAGMPDANIIRGQEFINDALLDVNDALLVNSVIADPATVAEHTEGTYLGSSYAHGRWTDGNILFIDEVTSGPDTGLRNVEVDSLDPDNFFHYLYGDAADTNFGTNATGTYNFLSGTASTDTHDGFVGTGVVSGTLTFDFASLNGTLDMQVLHDTSYLVSGDLFIDPVYPVDFSEVISGTPVTAVTTGGLCDNGCETLINGTFFGSLAGSGVNGAPVLAGLDYEIITEPYDGEIGNSIIGNAVFGRSGTAAPIPDVFTVTPNQNLVVVLPNPDPMPPPDEFADVGVIFDITSVTGNDSTSRNGLLLAAGNEPDDQTTDIFFVAATIDPDGMLGVSDPDPNLVAAQGLINDALVSDNALVQSVNNDPARVAEFFQGTGFAYGRWADGNVLFLDENLTSGGKTVEVDTLTAYQSLHFIYGDTPATTATGATGTYDFTGGTQSTTVSGATIGNGVTSGQLTFDFDALSGTIAMTVDHLTNYNVSGALTIDPMSPGGFFDQGVTAVTMGGNCDTGCATFIDGGFAGPLSGGAQASPAFAGLEYDIMDPVDGIMGVAAFNRTGDGPAPLP